MTVTPATEAPAAAAGLLCGLTQSQLQAVQTASATVCVLASAGAGKTRVLTRRIAHRIGTGSAAADHVAAITFTRKAAGELRDRLSELGSDAPVTAGTFHSFALAQLRRYWADRRTPEPVLMERKGRLVAELAAGRPGLAEALPGELANELEWAKARLVTPASYAEAALGAHRQLPADAEAIASLYARYEDEKRRRRVVDFDDLLARYASALQSDPRFAAAQRWRWRHVFVDELQDVNPLQWRVLEQLLGENDDLFVVGDPNQAIYGWNGADPGFLADFPQRWPSAEVICLDENHRCSPEIVRAAVAVLGRQGKGHPRSSRPSGALPELRSFSSEETEAAGIAAQLRAAHERGLPWGDMAVLARTNSQLEVIASCLSRAQVPAQTVGAEGTGPESTMGDPACVTLSSFHRSKGLQWPAVWVCGLEAGLVPIVHATGPAALAEERRLLYVALTRAERELYCSWAITRRVTSGASLRREPSPWLAALAPYCNGPHRSVSGPLPSPTAAPRAAKDAVVVDFLAAARRRLPGWAPAGADEAGEAEDAAAAVSRSTAERLRDWRKRLARASGVPPHVLLHDATIRELAQRRPSSTDELLAVPGLGPVKVARYGPAILEVVGAPNCARSQ